MPSSRARPASGAAVSAGAMLAARSPVDLHSRLKAAAVQLQGFEGPCLEAPSFLAPGATPARQSGLPGTQKENTEGAVLCQRLPSDRRARTSQKDLSRRDMRGVLARMPRGSLSIPQRKTKPGRTHSCSLGCRRAQLCPQACPGCERVTDTETWEVLVATLEFQWHRPAGIFQHPSCNGRLECRFGSASVFLVR